MKCIISIAFDMPKVQEIAITISLGCMARLWKWHASCLLSGGTNRNLAQRWEGQVTHQLSSASHSAEQFPRCSCLQLQLPKWRLLQRIGLYWILEPEHQNTNPILEEALNNISFCYGEFSKEKTHQETFLAI